MSSLPSLPVHRIIRFILRYRILHILFWSWAIVDFVHLRIQYFGGTVTGYIPDVLMIKGTQIAGAYFAVYYLIPRFLDRGRQVLFFLYTLASILGSAVLTGLIQYLYALVTQGKPLTNLPVMIVSHAVDNAVATGVFVAAFIIASRYRAGQRARQLEKERLETELNFLKAQINPHFLFNALNNIYVLINLDPKVAGETLLRFSGLLRYQLYECTGQKVLAGRELSFLKDYITLEQLRNGDNLEVRVQMPDQLPPVQIAPFVLIPFVENAFKHVSRYSRLKNIIEIDARADEREFCFSVSNTYEEPEDNTGRPGGIGLQNVSRRLQLIYPAAHELEIRKENGLYTVKLKLYADKDELHHS